MFRIFITLFILIFTTYFMAAQSLPSQWRFDESTHTIVAGDQASDGFYDESRVEEIRLYFTESNYWSILTSNYNTKKDLLCKMVYKGETYDSVGVRFKGQTSYFMNSTSKKSFSISLDEYKKGQDINGYNNLNLNNSWQDPSMMREVVYYHLIRKHTPAAKANFVNLYLNDQLWGIYQNVQQLNKDFLEEWYVDNSGINVRADKPDGSDSGGGPGGGANWGDGTAGFNYLGTDTSLYQKYYTLKSAEAADPWKQLMQATKVIKESSNLLVDAPTVLDIDKTLWHLAAEVLFGDDDSYVYKGKMDYFLYQEPNTKRWSTYDYDANSTLLAEHATWSPFYNANKVNYPLLNRVLAVPQFRQRYLAHMRTLLNELMNQNAFNTYIDGVDALIKAHVIADPKKASTNANYPTSLVQLKKYVSDRRTYLFSNTEFKEESPVISNSSFSADGYLWQQPKVGQKTLLTCRATHSSGIKSVIVYVAHSIHSTYSLVNLSDDGTNGDAVANDNVWSAEIENKEAGVMTNFYFEAIANNTANTVTYYPSGTEHQLITYTTQPANANAISLVINEFMASNMGIIKDENDETEDWIELHNTTNNEIDLSGYFLTDSDTNLEKFQFGSGISIPAKGYLIVWADEDGTQGPLHANFRLSASGEKIILLNREKVELDRIAFGAQTADKSYARKPNGTGSFMISDHTFGQNNDSSATTDHAGYTLTIYPNPVSSIINVETNAPTASFIDIINLSGRMVYHGLDRVIHVDDLPSGVYLIKLANTIRKFVKI